MANNFPVENKNTLQPNLQELVKIIKNGMVNHFKSVSVEIVDCPDLRKEPFGLVESGLCGRTKILDVGGVPNLIPLPNLEKIYNFDDLAAIIEMENAYFVGAGAGGCHILGINSEMMANIKVGGNENIGTMVALVGNDQKCHLKKYQHKEFCLLGNFLACDGKPGKVLKVNASRRSSKENFVSALRQVIHASYGSDPVALGGVFLIKHGKAKLHVMPDFCKEPLQTDSDVEKWLKFYEMNSPLVCLSVLVSTDPGLDLRLEHTHCFSYHGEGGHYHYDTTPDDVEYEAYYSLAEEIWRIDRPEKTHTIGRD